MAINTIKFSEMISGGDLGTNDKTPGLFGNTNVLFNNPWTFLASGTTAERPIPAVEMYYRLRLNTTTGIYEYYDPTPALWVPLSGSGTGTVNPGVANSIAFYAANGQAVSPISPLANAVLASNGLGVPSMVTTLPTGLGIPGAVITASTAALLSGSVAAAPVSGTDLTNKSYVDSLVSAGVLSITGTTNQIIASSPTGNITLSLPQDIALGSTPTFGGMTLSSIPLGGASGGTGVNNGARTMTIGGNWSMLGAFTFAGTLTGNTAVTFPLSGILATTGQIPTLPLSLTNGGTAASLTASNGGIVYSTASAMAILSGTATARQMLMSGSSAAPTWSTTAWPTTSTINQILYSPSANNITGLATGNNGVLVTSAGGVPSISSTLPNMNIGNPTAGILTNTTAGGGLRSFQVFTTGAGATYTKPANVTSILVEVFGAGGGGGGCSGGGGQFNASAGGGGGGYARLWVPASAASYTYTVGVGGTAGSAAGGSGGTGGTTTFSARSLQATGGTGGQGSSAGTSATIGWSFGGAGGVGSNGNVNLSGSTGNDGSLISGNIRRGTGGSSALAGNGSGGGGSGGDGISATAVGAAGGVGGAGLIIVWEFS